MICSILNIIDNITTIFYNSWNNILNENSEPDKKLDELDDIRCYAYSKMNGKCELGASYKVHINNITKYYCSYHSEKFDRIKLPEQIIYDYIKDEDIKKIRECYNIANEILRYFIKDFNMLISLEIGKNKHHISSYALSDPILMTYKHNKKKYIFETSRIINIKEHRNFDGIKNYRTYIYYIYDVFEKTCKIKSKEIIEIYNTEINQLFNVLNDSCYYMMIHTYPNKYIIRHKKYVLYQDNTDILSNNLDALLINNLMSKSF